MLGALAAAPPRTLVLRGAVADYVGADGSDLAEGRAALGRVCAQSRVVGGLDL